MDKIYVQLHMKKCVCVSIYIHKSYWAKAIWIRYKPTKLGFDCVQTQGLYQTNLIMWLELGLLA